MIAADSNILMRITNAKDPHHILVGGAVARLLGQGETLIVFPQMHYELWTAATRPESSNGLGLSTDRCSAALKYLGGFFQLLPGPPDLYDRWQALVVAHQVKGKPAHDARIVAAMEARGATALLTFNGRDFARYPGITVIDPATVSP